MKMQPPVLIDEGLVIYHSLYWLKQERQTKSVKEKKCAGPCDVGSLSGLARIDCRG